MTRGEEGEATSEDYLVTARETVAGDILRRGDLDTEATKEPSVDSEGSNGRLGGYKGK
jgi:hypothetical protein